MSPIAHRLGNVSVMCASAKSNEDIEVARLEMQDSVIGVLAELNELKYRAEIVANVRQELTDLLRTEMTKGYETGLSLVAEMERASTAESLVLKLQSEVVKIQQLENEINSLRRSRAFRLGQALTSPLRVLRRIFT